MCFCHFLSFFQDHSEALEELERLELELAGPPKPIDMSMPSRKEGHLPRAIFVITMPIMVPLYLTLFDTKVPYSK